MQLRTEEAKLPVALSQI